MVQPPQEKRWSLADLELLGRDVAPFRLKEEIPGVELRIGLHKVGSVEHWIALGRDGKPISFSGTILGDRWWTTTTVPLFYPNPLASEYQKEIGGTYHATEMFNFMGDTESLFSEDTTTADVQVGWVRMSDWLPWMMTRSSAPLRRGGRNTSRGRGPLITRQSWCWSS